MMTRWTFMRHAQPDPGLSDPPLSEEGRESVRNVALRIDAIPSLIVHSPYERATETARLIASLRNDFVGSLQVNALLVPEADVAYSIDQLQEFYTGMDVLFVGHNPTITLLAEAFGAEENNRCIFVSLSLRDRVAIN